MSTTLERATFTTSRLLDFFSEKELTAQTGHGPAQWPLVILKELADNALDACEGVLGVSPRGPAPGEEGLQRLGRELDDGLSFDEPRPPPVQLQLAGREHAQVHGSV